MANSSKAFAVDGEISASYADLLEYVRTCKSCRRILRGGDFVKFVFDFVAALSRNCDIILSDADLSADEMAKMGIANSAEFSEPEINFAEDSFEALLDSVKKSASKITVFTSGTTGLPKKVEHSVKTLSRAVRMSEKHESDVWGFAYNPTHMAGLQVLFQTLFNGNTVVNLFGKAKENVFDAIRKYNITHISATPTFYRMLFPMPYACPSVRRITCGGEKSDGVLYDRLKTVFPNAKINNIYASTEFGTLLAASGEFFKIPDELEGKVKIDCGELCVHKDLLGASSSFVLDGDFYRTADMVELAGEDGKTFKFLSRKSNLLNVGGYKVNLEEIEGVLREIEWVADAVVYGKPNSVIGNILCADIKCIDGFSGDVSQLRAYLSKKLQSFKIPRKIQFVENMNYTNTGKIKR